MPTTLFEVARTELMRYHQVLKVKLQLQRSGASLFTRPRGIRWYLFIARTRSTWKGKLGTIKTFVDAGIKPTIFFASHTLLLSHKRRGPCLAFRMQNDFNPSHTRSSLHKPHIHEEWVLLTRGRPRSFSHSSSLRNLLRQHALSCPSELMSTPRIQTFSCSPPLQYDDVVLI